MTATPIPNQEPSDYSLPSQAELRLLFPNHPKLYARSLALILLVLVAIKDQKATTPKDGPVLSMSQVFYAILAGTAPGVEAVIRGNLPGTGAFTFRADGTLLDLVVLTWDGKGLSDCLGDTSTILTYGGPRGLKQNWDHYLQAIHTIHAVIDGGGVFHCGISGDWWNLPPQGGGFLVSQMPPDGGCSVVEVLP